MLPPERSVARLVALIATGLLGFTCCWSLASCAPRDPVVAIEEDLLAPCCWRQSLRDHESEIAARLRAEIATRVAAGEPPRAIEADLVHRYGEQIRALPADRDPRWLVGAFGGVAALLGLGWIVVIGRRRRSLPVVAIAEEEAYADRLDDELAGMD